MTQDLLKDEPLPVLFCDDSQLQQAFQSIPISINSHNRQLCRNQSSAEYGAEKPWNSAIQPTHHQSTQHSKITIINSQSKELIVSCICNKTKELDHPCSKMN
uniref:Uncharacterized protein n=1 Tax=Opuntia streptacantha TaxID=393608 RepID=A0A7C9D9P8_OPUST